jgi:biopolymer transport protein ExbB
MNKVQACWLATWKTAARVTETMFEHLLEPLFIYAHQGGTVIWYIMAVCFVLWTLIIERYCFIHFFFPGIARQSINEWQSRQDRRSWRAKKIRETLISQANARLSVSISTIRTLVAICPLLGLLGTVTGMVGVFEVIAIQGTSDAQAMASGIFRATIPTMTGLVVALSGLYFSARLTTIASDKTNQLADSLSPDHGVVPS